VRRLLAWLSGSSKGVWMESLIIYGDSAALWRASKAMSIAAFAAKTAVDWTIQSLFHAGPGISSIAISFDLP